MRQGRSIDTKGNMNFHRLSTDEGVTFLSPPETLLERCPLANIDAHNLTSKNDSNDLDAAISNYFWHRRMHTGFELKTQLAHVCEIGFPGGYISAQEKILLSGASGDRARNGYRKSVEVAGDAPDELVKYFKDRAQPHSVKIAEPAESPVATECKNFFNFFHFLTETLHLVHFGAEATKTTGRQKFVVSKSKEKKPFVDAWLNAALTDFQSGGCTTVSRWDAEARDAYIALSAKHLLYQLDGHHHQIIEMARPSGWKWGGYDASPNSVNTLALNSYDSSLKQLRHGILNIGLQKDSLAGREFPEYIYIARSSTGARRREMPGEADLMNLCREFGFVVVYFEDMPPIEQAMHVNRAKVVVLQHGAGLANMMFASEKTHVIEIGTSQTAFGRWADFIPLAHLAGCHYHAVFVDMDLPDGAPQPVFDRDGLIAPRLTPATIDKIIEIVGACKKNAISGPIAGLVAHSEYFRRRSAWKELRRLLSLAIKDFSKDYRFWAQKGRLEEKTGNRAEAAQAFLNAYQISGAGRFGAEYKSLTGESPDDASRH